MIENNKQYTFDTHGQDSTYNVYSGETVTVIRPLTDKEADLFDVGMMYKVQLPNGSIIDAFEDELIINKREQDSIIASAKQSIKADDYCGAKQSIKISY